MRLRKGFTLLEMLVVVAIIIILLAFMIPLFNRSKEHARMTGCANKLRQLGSALELFALDNGGIYPSTGSPSWGTMLYPSYLDDEKVFDCPLKSGVGTAASPDYAYSQPTDGTPGNAEVLTDYTSHLPYGRIALYRSGKVIIK